MILDFRVIQKKYHAQAFEAFNRGIDFYLTFDEWLGIWIKSGHLHERGKRSGQYVMARYGDKGSYRVGNVKIVLHSENIREAQVGKQHFLGKTHTPETREKIRKRMLGNKYGVGRVKSPEERAASSKRMKDRIVTPETRARMKAARALRPRTVLRHSAETREKMRASHLRRWAEKKREKTLNERSAEALS